MSDVKHTTDWEEIIELVDQEIPASRGEYLKEHLKECKECQDKLAALDKLSGTVHKWDVPQLPVQRAERMLQNVQSQNLAKPGIIAALIEKLGWPGTVAAAGVVLATCALLLALLARTQTISLSTAILQRPRPKSIALSPYAANLHEQNATPSGDQLFRSGNSWSETTAKVQSHAEPDVPAPMIARTVSLSIVAKDLTATRRSFEAILARHHGYAADLTADAQQDSARSLQASLRIPAGELEAALAELKALGTLENESQKGEEVTQQHSDLLARLKNSRQTEQRLQAILARPTGKMSDVLEVEQEITRVRGQIEGMEAEQKGLEHRVDFATVELNVSEQYRAQLGAPSLSNRFRNALVGGFQRAADTVVEILIFFMNNGPTLLLWLAILFFPARFVRRRLKAIQEQSAI